jgi:uncharacterized protein DUF6966
MQKTGQLVETLDRLIEILASLSESHWRKYVAKCRSLIASGHDGGITKLLGAYGGMGSLNDLVGDTEESDIALRQLVAESYDLAKAVQLGRTVGGT